MKITVLAVGKNKTTYYDNALAEYQKRLSRWIKITWLIIPASTKDNESVHLMQATAQSPYVILLDERGQQWSTPDLAKHLEKIQNMSLKSVTFIVGGAHGVSQAVRDRADSVWSLSKLIFPHEMARLILTEQLYRAYDILNNGKYHHS